MPFSLKIKSSLYKKSKNSGIPIDILEEVFIRGYNLWNESFKGSREQFAFDRVNSFVAGGFAADLDKDLLNESKKGLWDNIWAKRKRIAKGSGEKMRTPGSKGAPTQEALKKSQVKEETILNKKVLSVEETDTPTAEKQSKNPDKSSSRFDGTNSLVKVFKDTTPGQSEKETPNMKEETLFNKIKRILELDEAKSPAWQRKEGKDPEGGLNKKGVASYRAQNPGSKLQTAVTTEPSKLKKGSKKAKRRLSFCRRMKGMKNKLTSAKTARDPNSRINKSLRKWNC